MEAQRSGRASLDLCARQEAHLLTMSLPGFGQPSIYQVHKNCVGEERSVACEVSGGCIQEGTVIELGSLEETG